MCPKRRWFIYIFELLPCSRQNFPTLGSGPEHWKKHLHVKSVAILLEHAIRAPFFACIQYTEPTLTTRGTTLPVQSF